MQIILVQKLSIWLVAMATERLNLQVDFGCFMTGITDVYIVLVEWGGGGAGGEYESTGRAI